MSEPYKCLRHGVLGCNRLNDCILDATNVMRHHPTCNCDQCIVARRWFREQVRIVKGPMPPTEFESERVRIRVVWPDGSINHHYVKEGDTLTITESPNAGITVNRKAAYRQMANAQISELRDAVNGLQRTLDALA